MVRRRWAAAVALAACLLSLHLVVPGLAQGGRTAEAGVTVAAGAVNAVDAVEPGATSDAEAQERRAEEASAEGDSAERAEADRAEAARAGEPCPFEEEPSVRQTAARTPRAAGAARAGVVTGAPVVDRGGTDVRAAGTGRRPGALASAPNAVELQTFRC